MRRKLPGWVGGASLIFGATNLSLSAFAADNQLDYSTNWSGYFASASSGSTFNEISSDWVLPTVHASSIGTTYSAYWVGFDGVTDGTVEQCGVSGDVTSGGSTSYYAWYEFYPAGEVEIPSLTVHPGDTIDAQITYENSESSSKHYAYYFDLSDVTDGESYANTLITSSNDARSSAEWIAEAPTVGGKQATLANFGSVTFSNDEAELNSGSLEELGALGAFNNTETAMYQNNTVIALPTPLSNNGETFSVNFDLTWDNAGAPSPSDGKTWDIGVNNNWNTGAASTVYTEGSNVTFNDNNNGNYAVTLNTTVNPASVTVNATGNYTISGAGTIGGTGSLTKSNTGTLTLATANTYTGGTNVSAGLLLIEPTSSTTSALPNGALNISGGEVQLASNVTLGSQSSNTPATAPTSNVNLTSLSITGSGVLDIVNNHIIINYGSGPDPIASIAGWIASAAYGSGSAVTWTGTGITSSAAAANPSHYGIGYADAADPGNPAGLASGQIELMYTLLGDTNLDGKVNGTDFATLATNFNSSVTNGWDEGDFNYDGKVNGTDLQLLQSNFNQQANGSAVAAADLAALDSFAAANGINLNPTNVPEPASAAIFVMAGLGFVRRRRRSSR